jgi:hypothetical protein
VTGVAREAHEGFAAVRRSWKPAPVDRVWLTGGLITLADALERNNYFDRAPHLKLVRHLRNGVSHEVHLSIAVKSA